MVSSGNSRMVWLGVVGFCAVLAFGCKPALAASHWDVGLGVGFSQPVYSDGHYETRVERVIVAPERVERQWIGAAYETRYIHGRPQTVLVRDGFYRDVIVPARVEERYVKVWVPCSRPVVTGGFFGLGFGRTRR